MTFLSDLAMAGAFGVRFAFLDSLGSSIFGYNGSELSEIGGLILVNNYIGKPFLKKSNRYSILLVSM